MPRFIKFYDANRLKKTYPLYRRKPIETLITNVENSGVQAEVAKIVFNNSIEETYTFLEEYEFLPICVVSPEESATSDSANVNLYIKSLTLTQVVIAASNEFTGIANLQIFEPES